MQPVVDAPEAVECGSILAIEHTSLDFKKNHYPKY